MTSSSRTGGPDGLIRADDPSFALFSLKKRKCSETTNGNQSFRPQHKKATGEKKLSNPSAKLNSLDSLETNEIIGNDDTKLPCSCVRVSECKFHRIVLAIVCVFISSCVPPFLIFGQERQLFGCCNFDSLGFRHLSFHFNKTRSHTFSLRAKPKYFFHFSTLSG